MRSAMSPSWELRFDVREEPHIALYVRDALRFGTEVGRQPPRLIGEIPDLRSLVGERSSERLELHFRPWCQEDHLADPWRLPRIRERADLEILQREFEARAADFYAPLDEHRALRDKASDWWREQRERYEPHRPDPDGARCRWEISRDAAAAAADQLAVDPGELSADTGLMMVRGLWWATPRPGQLLYSPAVRDDRGLFRDLLQDTFVASVSR